MSMSNSSSSLKWLKEQLDYEALLQNADTPKGELEKLQLLNERLNGEGVCGLSYPELWSRESQLHQGLLSVNDQLEKVEDELLAKQEAEEEVMGTEWIDNYMNENLTCQLVLSARRKILRKQAREIRSSSGERQVEHDREALLQKIEPVKSEMERLRLLNERMSGLSDEKDEKVRIVLARQCKELEMLKRGSGQIVPVSEHGQSSMDNATYDHKGETSSRLRFLEIN